MSAVHVVIGGGTIGSRLADILSAQRKKIVVVTRTATGTSRAGVDHRSADATDVDSLMSVTTEALVVYNCANPPYTAWEAQWPRITQAVNEYAVRSGADVVTCSNLYGYGPYEDTLTEDLPLRATWRNGRARADAWQAAKALYDAGSLRVTEVRGSDYLCASEQSRMGHRVVPNLILGKPVQLLGALDQPHTWTDPDDVAQLMALLANDDRSWGKAWHVPSNDPRTQRQVVTDIAEALGVTAYRLSSVSKPIEVMLGLFNPLIRELTRGDYQFTHPFIMESDSARTTFGLSATPWSDVIRDLIQPYLEVMNRESKEALASLGHRRLDEVLGDTL